MTVDWVLVYRKSCRRISRRRGHAALRPSRSAGLLTKRNGISTEERVDSCVKVAGNSEKVRFDPIYALFANTAHLRAGYPSGMPRHPKSVAAFGAILQERFPCPGFRSGSFEHDMELPFATA